jgi:hypothetical protein
MNAVDILKYGQLTVLRTLDGFASRQHGKHQGHVVSGP